MAKIGVDEPGFNPAVRAYHQRRGDGQRPAAMTLKSFKIDAELAVSLLDFLAHPEDQAERKRVGQIEVGQYPERQPPACCKVRAYLAVSGTIETTSPPSATISG